MGKHSIYVSKATESLLLGNRPGLQIQQLMALGIATLDQLTPRLDMATWVRCLKAAEKLREPFSHGELREILGDEHGHLGLLCVAFVCWRYWLQAEIENPGENLSARLLAAGARIA